MQTRLLLESGAAEIVLSGVDITAWGADLGEGLALGNLVCGLLEAVPELTRLRLTSLDPAEIDEVLWDVITSEERLLPHLHLSLQSGDDLILKRMKRRHSRNDAIAFCDGPKFRWVLISSPGFRPNRMMHSPIRWRWWTIVGFRSCMFFLIRCGLGPRRRECPKCPSRCGVRGRGGCAPRDRHMWAKNLKTSPC